MRTFCLTAYWCACKMENHLESVFHDFDKGGDYGQTCSSDVVVDDSTSDVGESARLTFGAAFAAAGSGCRSDG